MYFLPIVSARIDNGPKLPHTTDVATWEAVAMSMTTPLRFLLLSLSSQSGTTKGKGGDEVL